MIPNFNYEDKTNIDIISWLKSDYNFKVNSSILKEEMKVQKIMVKKLYNNLCIKYIIILVGMNSLKILLKRIQKIIQL